MGRIGIIDWGIGGIGIYRRLKARFPHAAVTYFSDTGFTPYGKTTRRELISRLNGVLRFLERRGVTQVCIGCNAASTVVDELHNGGLEVSGVIAPAIEFTAKQRPTRLGLIGGRRTVVSGVYRCGFAAKYINHHQHLAQPLSGLIESGDADSGVLHRESKKHLAPLRNCSHILLACSHYPAISGLLAKYVSPQTKFIDPADAVVDALSISKGVEKGADVFLTTGNPKDMRRAAKTAWSIELRSPKHIERV